MRDLNYGETIDLVLQQLVELSVEQLAHLSRVVQEIRANSETQQSPSPSTLEHQGTKGVRRVRELTLTVGSLVV